MGRGKEIFKLRLENGYAGELKSRAGTQEALAALAEIDQSTVSRVLRGGPTTYDTLMKICSAVPGMPEPVISVRDHEHLNWCKLGAALQKIDPKRFAAVLSYAADQAAFSGISDEEWSTTLPAPPTPEAMDALKSLIANPLRTDRKKGVSRG